jgi:hypothetical protein
MLNFTRTIRAAGATSAALMLLLLAPVAHAGLSEAVFAYTGASFATSLQVTAGGVTTIVATNRGWYDSTGSPNGASPTNNYIAGLCGNDACRTSPDALTNNWFVFSNLAAGAPITAASLLLSVPPNGANPGYISPTPSLLYTVYDVTTPIANLGTAGVAIYTDLGSGTVYGTRSYTAADMGTLTAEPLNAAAIAYLNANRGALVAFGGSVQIVSIAVPVMDHWPLLVLMALLLLGTAAAALRLRRA